MWPTGAINEPQRKIALSVVITILGNYTGTIGKGKIMLWILGTPAYQFSSSGFFGTTDNSNNPPCAVIINGMITPMTVIGYDSPGASMAGFTDGVDLNAGTTISLQVINY